MLKYVLLVNRHYALNGETFYVNDTEFEAINNIFVLFKKETILFQKLSLDKIYCIWKIVW